MKPYYIDGGTICSRWIDLESIVSISTPFVYEGQTEIQFHIWCKFMQQPIGVISVGQFQGIDELIFSVKRHPMTTQEIVAFHKIHHDLVQAWKNEVH